MTEVCSTYTPSALDTQNFWDREHTRQKASVDIPYGFPKELNAPCVWTGADIENKESEWKLDLTEGEVAAIDAALTGFEGWSCRIRCLYLQN
jgi:hypothetical protein